jgi:hypothetical protein
MDIRTTNRFLKHSLELSEELIEFVEGCLKRIYNEDSIHAIRIFNEDLDCAQYNGCLQPLCRIDKQIEEIKLREIERG